MKDEVNEKGYILGRPWSPDDPENWEMDIAEIVRMPLTEEGRAKIRRERERIKEMHEYKQEHCPSCGSKPNYLRTRNWVWGYNDNIPVTDKKYVVGCMNKECPDHMKNLFFCDDLLEGFCMWSEAMKARKKEY